jgi:hypothetical protein
VGVLEEGGGTGVGVAVRGHGHMGTARGRGVQEGGRQTGPGMTQGARGGDEGAMAVVTHGCRKVSVGAGCIVAGHRGDTPHATAAPI